MNTLFFGKPSALGGLSLRMCHMHLGGWGLQCPCYIVACAYHTCAIATACSREVLAYTIIQKFVKSYPFLPLQSTQMLNKNTLGCKKVRRQSEAALQTGRCDQKLWYQLRPRNYFITNIFNSLNDDDLSAVISNYGSECIWE